jgi:hypothetical protein
MRLLRFVHVPVLLAACACQDPETPTLDVANSDLVCPAFEPAEAAEPVDFADLADERPGRYRLVAEEVHSWVGLGTLEFMVSTDPESRPTVACNAFSEGWGDRPFLLTFESSVLAWDRQTGEVEEAAAVTWVVWPDGVAERSTTRATTSDAGFGPDAKFARLSNDRVEVFERFGDRLMGVEIRSIFALDP